MAAFGRLTVSGVTGSNENTLALVNFNIDFSLLKINPPQEFLEVGKSLSVCRRKEAEEGHIHQTARRLGAIFERLLPSTPNLIRHYGTRASQIAQCVTSSSKAPRVEGMFSRQVGVDGASIWAAATSSSGALQVHLLACMLARMWPQSEAISIWEELLNSKKTEIKDTLQQEGTLDMAALSAHASLQSITREQLGEWDSSARAWLRTADRSSIVLVRQNQLDQIVSKTRNQVNDREALYSNVIETWKNALAGVEQLLQGSPHEMQTGEVLLGLHAWHLYPDINLLGDPNILADFKDPLVSKGGILTIGLVRNTDSTLSKGLHWSLPLAHLRYYGDPVKRTGKLSGVQNRISLPEFMQAVLGVLMKLWNVDGAAIFDTLNWIRHLHELVTDIGLSRAENNWLALLSQASKDFIESKGDQSMLNKRLFHAGRAYGSKSLLGRCTAPFFGLSQTHYLFHLLKTQEAKIKFIRDMMHSQSQFDGDMIIRYMNQETGMEEFASVFPATSGRRTAKRSHDGNVLKHGNVHCRWIHRDTKFYQKPRESEATSSIQHQDIFMGAQAEKSKDISTDISNEGGRSPPTIENNSKELSPSISQKEEVNSSSKPERDRATNRIEERARFLEGLGEEVRAVAEEHLETLEMHNDIRVIWGQLEELTEINEYERNEAKWEWSRPYGEIIHFSLLLGDPTDVTLFLRMSQREPIIPEQMDFRIVKDIFQSGDLNLDLLPAILFDAMASSSDQCGRSLQAVATIHQVYESLPGATIAIKVLEFKGSLFNANWLPSSTTGIPLWIRQDQSEQSERTVRHGEEAYEEDEEQEYDTDVPDHFEQAFDSVGSAAKLPGREKSAFFRKRIGSLLRSYQAGFMDPVELSLAESFSCVLLCDSGVFNIPARQMDEIMAIASGDSLFIAAPLLSDPAENRSKGPKIKHIIGNIGRPGTALLKSPDDPRIRKVGVEQWYFVSGEMWDGKRKDAFGDTSLHLWFTGSSLAIDRKNETLGEKDVALYMLESVVSVHGRGTTEGAEVCEGCI
jgi:hypothetical protein